MNISNTRYYLLQFSTHYATLYTWNDSRRENRYASGRRDLLDNETSCEALQCIRRNDQAVCQNEPTESRQIWRSYSYPRGCNTGVHREEAKQKVASWEAQNVRSLSSNSLPDILDNRPRNHTATYCSRLYPFVHIVLTETVSTICTKGYKRLQYVAVWFLGLLSKMSGKLLDDRLLTFWASHEATFCFASSRCTPVLHPLGYEYDRQI